jgi:hypothetical protein
MDAKLVPILNAVQLEQAIFNKWTALSMKKLSPCKEAKEFKEILSFFTANLLLYANFLSGPINQRAKRLIAFWKAVNLLANNRSTMTRN